MRMGKYSMQIITKESRAAYTNIRQSRLSVKSPSRDKEGIDIMRKGSILQEKIKIINICTPSIRAPQQMKQTLTEERIIVGDCYCSLRNKENNQTQDP